MANLSKIKRDRMLSFIEQLKEANKDNDDNIKALNEIANALDEKRYGLVWEEHTEKVDEELETKIPVFKEVNEKKIKLSDMNSYNFILEGDNLHSLYLLEKTHSGKIDVIFIDPPYFTGNEDFIYNDNFVTKEDDFKHSKWLSFMEKRLKIAKKLLDKKGIIFISIDDNEQAQLKILCDQVFGDNNFLATFHIQVRYAEKSLTDGKPVKPVMEYVHIYAKNIDMLELNLPMEEYTDDSFIYDIIEKGDGQKVSFENGTDMIVFGKGEWELVKKEPNKSLLKETWVSGTIYSKMSYGQVVKRYIEPRYEIDGLGCLYKVLGRGDDGRGYRYYVGPAKAGATRCKMYSGMPLERVDEINSGDGSFRQVPLSNYINYAPDFGNIVNEGGVSFNSGKKPIKMLKELINYHPKKNAIVLDFFAGSGSTGHAVLSLNKEDGGHRTFILAQTNERGICESKTYPRIRTVVTGIKADGKKYLESLPSNVKYFQTDYISRSDEFLKESLMEHINEMIELENGIEIDNKEYLVLLNDDAIDDIEKDWSNYNNVKCVFISSDCLLTESQKKMFKGVKMVEIPDYYFDFEIREAE